MLLLQRWTLIAEQLRLGPAGWRIKKPRDRFYVHTTSIYDGSARSNLLPARQIAEMHLYRHRHRHRHHESFQDGQATTMSALKECSHIVEDTVVHNKTPVRKSQNCSSKGGEVVRNMTTDTSLPSSRRAAKTCFCLKDRSSFWV